MEVKPSYQQTEVGVIPQDWDVKSANQLGTPVRGGSPRPAGDPRYFNGSYIPWLTVAAMTNIPESQLVVSETATCLTEEGSLHSRTLTAGTLIIANSGATLGVAKILGVKCCANDGIAALLNLSKHVSPRYLAHFINTKTSYLRDIVATGNGQPNLNTELIGNFKIPLPSTKAEQEAIAEALSDADALIESVEQLLAKKRQLKQGAMQELLTGKRRLPGFSGEWEVKRLGDVVEIQKGDLITEKNALAGVIPVIAGGKQPAYFHNCANRSGKTITISGSGANAGYVAFYSTPLFASDCSTIGEGANYSVEFIYFVLLLNQGAIYKAQTGGAQPHIHPNDLRPLWISVPETKDEQIAIAVILFDMDVEIAALEAKLAKSSQLKQGMMQELLTGRIRLVEPGANVGRLPVRHTSVRAPTKSHNWQINEAVVISVLAKSFGSEQWPLGRKRYTKLSYLLHRYAEGQAEGYLKKAAGPYNPATKYKGPEEIALKKGYARRHTRDKFSGFVAAERIGEAESYFVKWYGKDVLAWLDQFRRKSNDELELLATVDMAMVDLRSGNKAVQLADVKRIIRDHPEWEAKLDRATFSDDKISQAMRSCRQLLGFEE